MNGPPRPPLRLVHPAKPAEPDPTPRTRSGKRRPYQNDLFSPDEKARLRAALKNARPLFGTWACLADAMRVPTKVVFEAANGSHRVSGAVAIRLARALGVPLESLYRAPADASTCPHCGARRAS
jgi:hypothetical protein